MLTVTIMGIAAGKSTEFPFATFWNLKGKFAGSAPPTFCLFCWPDGSIWPICLLGLERGYSSSCSSWWPVPSTGVILSTLGSSLSWNERLFLTGWPRT